MLQMPNVNCAPRYKPVNDPVRKKTNLDQLTAFIGKTLLKIQNTIRKS
jgi:hypothetical protein